MTLDTEISKASQDRKKDGYDMSVGELLNLYRDEELVIDPEFQRYFRWDETRKTRFIESLLLGIPIPPVFVFQTKDGVWELIDGLQRLSTIFEFVGILKGVDGNICPPSVLEGTKMLPSLRDKQWLSGEKGLSKPQQLQIKRARIRVEILTKESDPQSKYELFQRLNTGGESLSEQEVRNCILIKVNSEFYQWMKLLSRHKDFRETVLLSENAEMKQKDLELVLRFLVIKNIEYKGGLDVNEFFDESMLTLANDAKFDFAKEEADFVEVFSLINLAHGGESFRRHDGSKFLGQFLISSYEAISYGIFKNIAIIKAVENPIEFVQGKIESLWEHEPFREFTKAGTRGTTRLQKMLPIAEEFFKP